MKMPELLAPAGNWSCLKTAVINGADAVYFGVKGMNMRDSADNFEVSEIPVVMRYLHENGRKGYLTLNTVYYNRELKKLEKVVSAAKNAGVDAVICWDMAVMNLAEKAGLCVHISTQAGVSNYGAFKFYAKLGAKRIILARECSLSDINEIHLMAGADGLDCEIEAFIHGAMCVSVSGRCFLSASTFKKSANRGQCVQPCRRLYRITDVEDDENSYVLGKDFVLSPKDLCTIEILPELVGAGINSFKIEGRSRPPEYVKTAVSCYRSALNAIKDGSFTPEYAKKLKSELSKAYNRGFSTGFYEGMDDDWISTGPKSKELKVYCGDVVNYYKKINVAEFFIRSEKICVGDKILVYGKTTPAGYSAVEEIQIEHNPVDFADKGQRCGIKLPFFARPGDKLFLVRDSGR
ncbi:putative protease [Methanomicrobium sp. W14]|uniref:peptidase U32 family protein n=1 Tax=Methanomicrobium sp. W14 TaxID=2817839 RepID=UPI001AE290C1|nr:peptidase U32 family protein [Methanomicrobium sp. W14]MBP2132376.1 putative protease [Methanomicrobium sp. W14]